MQFSKEYILPSEREKEQRIEQAVIALERFVDSHRPNRIYKKPSNAKKLDIKQQVRIFIVCETQLICFRPVGGHICLDPSNLIILVSTF